MALTEDQHPAGDLGPRGEQEPFRIGIRTRASGWDDHGFGACAGKAHPGQQSVNVLVVLVSSGVTVASASAMLARECAARCGHFIAAYATAC